MRFSESDKGVFRMNPAQIVVKTIASTVMVMINAIMFFSSDISDKAKRTFTVVNLLTLTAIWI